MSFVPLNQRKKRLSCPPARLLLFFPSIPYWRTCPLALWWQVLHRCIVLLFFLALSVLSVDPHPLLTWTYPLAPPPPQITPADFEWLVERPPSNQPKTCLLWYVVVLCSLFLSFPAYTTSGSANTWGVKRGKYTPHSRMEIWKWSNWGKRCVYACIHVYVLYVSMWFA